MSQPTFSPAVSSGTGRLPRRVCKTLVMAGVAAAMVPTVAAASSAQADTRNPSTSLRMVDEADVFASIQQVTGAPSFNGSLVKTECSPDSASAKSESVAGTIYSCDSSDGFGSEVLFRPKGAETDVRLAEFRDTDVGAYSTRRVLNGGKCEVVLNRVAKECFSRASGAVARTFVPAVNFGSNTDGVSAHLKSTFGPNTVQYSGQPGRCYSDTGSFQVKGLSHAGAAVAREVRNGHYAECKNIEGNNRFWASRAWTIPTVAGGTVVAAAPILPVLVISAVAVYI